MHRIETSHTHTHRGESCISKIKCNLKSQRPQLAPESKVGRQSTTVSNSCFVYLANQNQYIKSMWWVCKHPLSFEDVQADGLSFGQVLTPDSGNVLKDTGCSRILILMKQKHKQLLPSKSSEWHWVYCFHKLNFWTDANCYKYWYSLYHFFIKVFR